jgi:hypothetical protein
MTGRQCRTVESCAGSDGATDPHASGRLTRRDPCELLDELGAAPVPEAEGEAVAAQTVAGAVVDLARRDTRKASRRRPASSTNAVSAHNSSSLAGASAVPATVASCSRTRRTSSVSSSIAVMGRV